MDIDVTEDIITGLSEDVALRCLAMISHGYYGSLQCVSKKWQRTLKSMDYANLKAKEGWCGNWLFTSTNLGHKSQWNAYDPDANKWHPLPKLPAAKYNECFTGYSCVSVCKRFLVIGGCYDLTFQGNRDTNDVRMFDPFKQTWSSVSNMGLGRTYFACAAIGHKVYVAGGNNSITAEIYDPYMDRWENLPPMPIPLPQCIGLSYENQFHVIGNQHIIFNPKDQQWRIADVSWPFPKLPHGTTSVLDGRIYSVFDDTIRVANTETKDWVTLGTFPTVVFPGHPRRLKPFGFKLTGFKNHLYVFGGMALKFDSNTHSYDLVDLNTTMFCDPTKTPLEWRDARPMPMPSSGVMGCALVEE